MANKKNEKRKVGKRSLLLSAPEKIDDFIKCVECGMTIEASCDYASINPDTIYNYLAKAREGNKDYTEFAERYKKARAKCRIVNLKNIFEASKSSWQASAWLLERIFPSEFKNPSNNNNSSNDGENYVDTLKGFRK